MYAEGRGLFATILIHSRRHCSHHHNRLPGTFIPNVYLVFIFVQYKNITDVDASCLTRKYDDYIFIHSRKTIYGYELQLNRKKYSLIKSVLNYLFPNNTVNPPTLVFSI